MKMIAFAYKPAELSCLIGNLFAELKPPCDALYSDALTICGTTFSGASGKLMIRQTECLFYGVESDLQAVRDGICLERRCCHG